MPPRRDDSAIESGAGTSNRTEGDYLRLPRKLALIAHDYKKVDLVAWTRFNRDSLAEFDLVGTGHTGAIRP